METPPARSAEEAAKQICPFARNICPFHEKKGTIFRWFLRGANRIWTGDQGVADPRLTAWLSRHGDPNEIRTRVTAVKGRCLNRLTMGPYFIVCFLFRNYTKTPRVGLEPTTARLTAACSTDWAIEEYLSHLLLYSYAARSQVGTWKIGNKIFCKKN